MDSLSRNVLGLSQVSAKSPDLASKDEIDSKVLSSAKDETSEKSYEEGPIPPPSPRPSVSTSSKSSFSENFPTGTLVLQRKERSFSFISEPIFKGSLDSMKKNRSDPSVGSIENEPSISSSPKSLVVGKLPKLTFPLLESHKPSSFSSSEFSAGSMQLEIRTSIDRIIEALRCGAVKECSSEILSARKNLELDPLGSSFERHLGEVIGAHGNLKLLEEYFSSPFSRDFIEGFLEAEIRKNTAFSVVVEFIKIGVDRAQDCSHFRHETLYNSVCCVYFSMRLDSSIRALQKKILYFRERIDRKSNKDNVFSPAFCGFCRMSLEHIYDNLILDQDLSFLLQRKYQLLEAKFPESALQIAGDLIFLRVLNPYFCGQNILSEKKQKDFLQLTRFIQKVCNGSYFNGGSDVEEVNSLIGSFAKRHKEYLHQYLGRSRMLG